MTAQRPATENEPTTASTPTERRVSESYEAELRCGITLGALADDATDPEDAD